MNKLEKDLCTPLYDHEAELIALRARCRETAQLLIAAIGADGPEDCDDAARRAVAVIADLRGKYATLRRDNEDCHGRRIAEQEAASEWEHECDVLKAECELLADAAERADQRALALRAALEELPRALAAVAVVGSIDGHDAIRRESVLNIARARAEALRHE
jgi:hypothetical protein